MKHLAFLLVVGLAAIVGVLTAEGAEATTVCQGGSGPTVANTCHGFAHTSTNDALGTSARCFAFRTVNTAPTCTTSGITPTNDAWEIVAGACTTLYYFDTASGLSPPAVPNKVSLAIGFDNTATIVILYQNMAAEPANGAPFTFCATSNGLVGGSARAGTYSVVLNAIKDNAVGGVGNYNVHSATSGVARDRGAIRGTMLVASVARSAYPSGSTFAYGPAGDETITITAGFTTPNGDANLETMTTGIIDDATKMIGQLGATVDVDSGSLAQGFVVDSTFMVANSPYVGVVGPIGDAALTGQRWTILAPGGHGSNIVRLSDNVAYDSTTFNIDPRINFDTNNAGSPDGLAVVRLTNGAGPITTLFNRGETPHGELYLQNARGEYLSRAMTFNTLDASSNSCVSHGSVAPSSNKYTLTAAIPTGGPCTVAATGSGAARHYRATNTDQSQVSLQVFSVDTSLYPDAHPQDSGTLVPDDYPTEDAGETLLFHIAAGGGGVDASDHIRPFCKAENVRHENLDTSGSAITWAIRDPTSAVRASGTTDSGSDGWTAVLADFLASTPLGTNWSLQCSVTFNGNSGSDTEQFTITVEGGGGGETVYTGADPLTIFADQPDNGTVWVAVHSRLLNGEARIGVADEIFVSAFTCSGMTPVVTDQAVTEVDPVDAPGAYAYGFAYPGPGCYLLSANTTDGATPIGAHTVLTVFNGTGNLSADIAAGFASLEDHRSNTLEILGMEFAGLTFAELLLSALWLSILVWSLRARPRPYILLAAACSIGVALVFLPLPGMTTVAAVWLAFLAIWLEAIVGERVYERLLGSNPKGT